MAARAAAEQRLARRAAEAAGEQATASAVIGSFPFLPGLLIAGSVPHVRVRAETVTAGPLTVDSVEVDLDGVVLDRRAFSGGQVHLRAIDGGLVTVELDAGLVTDLVDVPVEIAGGVLRVMVAGQPLRARAVLDDGAVVISVAGLPALRLSVPRTDLSPCVATDVALTGTHLRLSCRIESVPPGLIP